MPQAPLHPLPLAFSVGKGEREVGTLSWAMKGDPELVRVGGLKGKSKCVAAMEITCL